MIFDYADSYGKARARIARWIASGDPKLAEHIVDGDVADCLDACRDGACPRTG